MALITTWGIVTILIILSIGIAIGLILMALGVAALRIGTIRFASDGESKPYLFLDLDEPPEKWSRQHWALVRIDATVITPK